jgi:hypothetical protein
MDERIKEPTAILARKAGFNVGCSYLHGEYNGFNGEHHVDNYNQFNANKQYSAPTQTTLKKWIRENHMLHVSSSFKLNIKKWDVIVFDLKLNGKEFIAYFREYDKTHPKRRLDKYEDAIEMGLVEALEIIILRNSEKSL